MLTWLPVALVTIFAVLVPPWATAQPVFAKAVNAGTVNVPGLSEASGLVASRNNAGVLWTHNDKGDSPRIFAIDTQGHWLGTYNLADAIHVDYEDIALGPGPVANVQYLFVGDIGDNKSKRAGIQVYRLPEPSVSLRQAAAPRTADSKGVVGITLLYPDGAHNAESLLVDPASGDLFVLTKQPGVAGVYQATASQLAVGGPVVLSRIGQVDFNVASGGDISPTGREIILRQEDYARLWTRTPGQTIASALAAAGVIIPVVGRPTEPNGEAIGFDAVGSGYYTLSDSAATQPLYHFARTSPLVSNRPRRLIAAGSTWRYLDDGAEPPPAWREVDFDDHQWKSGLAQFGYGDGDEQTLIAPHVATYFRTTFVITNRPGFFRLELKLLFDDGAAVFLNGTRIALANLSRNATYLTPATARQGALEDTWFTFPVAPELLAAGTNTLAAEIHQFTTSSVDLSFDAQLLLTETQPTRITSITRLPDGKLRLDVEAGLPELIVEQTANFTTWSPLATVTLTNRAGTFTVTCQPADTRAFYRLRAP